MNKKIALFTNGDKNYFYKAKRSFELFEELNPGVFDFYYITSDTDAVSLDNMNVIILDPNDYIEGFTDTGYAPESFLYYPAPDIFYERGYEYSMCIDADCVCLKELDFSWLTEDDFIVAGAPRLRDDLSEEIDAWYFLNGVNDKVTANFLENTFELQNKNNIIDIMDAVLIFNNKRWVSEKLYNKSYDLFKTCKDAGYRMRDTDILSALLFLDTPKSFYKYLPSSWNWYYEPHNIVSLGGDDVHILHMLAIKPWGDFTYNINRVLEKGRKRWVIDNKEDWRYSTRNWGFKNC